MEALIIADGGEKKLNHCSPLKPLIPIFGLSLIERIILEAKLAGITRFKIVVGYEASQIMKKIGNGDNYGVHVDYIFNPEWEKGNGTSVYKAKGYFKENFILLMSDNLFDDFILRKLQQVEPEGDSCILSVDHKLNSGHFNIDDVTKVWVENNKVEKIGKNLDRFNAVNAGIFLYSPVVFDTLEKGISQGKYSLLAANQMLSKQGKLKTIDISDNFWIDVDDKEALKKTKKMIIKQLKKPEDGTIPRNFYRKISVLISSKLSHLNINPNQITLTSFFLGALSGLFFFLGGYPKIVIGAFMAQLSWILDLCDGEIARLKFKESKFGEFLDRVLDRYVDGLIILGITFTCFRSLETIWVWLFGFLALIGSFMNSYTALEYDKHLASKAFIKKRTIRMGREIRLLIVFVGAVLNQLFAILLILSIVTNAESIRRLFVLRNEY
ncbi:MAG: CDP-alcohol phosphatidyltransferase family protein [Candidatus Aminicenantes bacterium]|nr:CDP-alcohol phosphatidyltransferase family protein [Candidatus Aminicenantes bacterium]